jgi:hypothetical protein
LSAPTLRETESLYPTIDRVLLMGSPVAGLLILAALFDGVLQNVVMWHWNDVRLARGVALWYGYGLYPGRDSNVPIIGTMHGPVPHLLYSCLAFLKDPTWLLMAGCALSCLLYFGAVLWLHLRGRAKVAGVYGFVACAALLLASPGARYAGLSVHVDALATCFAVLAAGILVRKEAVATRALVASAVLAMLSVASKQTMAPVAIALPCFVWMVDGRRAFARYVAVQATASAAIFAAMLALFRPPRDVLFNTFTLAIQQPNRGSIVPRVIEGIFDVRRDLAAAAAPLLLVIAVCALTPGSFRQKIAKHRWLVFLWMAALQLPIELRAWSTKGGDVNHLSVVMLFVTLSTTIGLVSLWKPDTTGLLARALLVGMLLAHFPIAYGIDHDLRRVGTNATQVAFDYERRYPGRTCFPFNPLATLLAEGRLTHFDDALWDRELAGFPVNALQFSAGFPAGCTLVAFPALEEPHSRMIRALIDDQPVAGEPGLKGWNVYRVKKRTTQSTSTSRPSSYRPGFHRSLLP